MKIALDPCMLRRVPLTDLPGLVADLGYSQIELSRREDFLPPSGTGSGPRVRHYLTKHGLPPAWRRSTVAS